MTTRKETSTCTARRIDRLRKAALRHRRNSREYDRLTDKLIARLADYRAERDEAERQRDAHADREVAAQKQLLEVESHIVPVWKLVEEQKQKIASLEDQVEALQAQRNELLARGDAT